MTITNTVGSSSREQVQGGWDTDNVIYIGSDSSDIEVLPAEPDPVDVDREGLVVKDWDQPYENNEDKEENEQGNVEQSRKGKERDVGERPGPNVSETDYKEWLKLMMEPWASDLIHRIELSRTQTPIPSKATRTILKRPYEAIDLNGDQQRDDVGSSGGLGKSADAGRSDTESLSSLLETLNKRCDVYGDHRFHPSDTAIQQIQPVASFFHSLSIDPYSFDFRSHPEVTIVTEREIQSVGISALYYIRQITFASLDNLVNSAMTFINQYPYRTCEILRLFIDLGVDEILLDFAIGVSGTANTTAATILPLDVLQAYRSRGPIKRQGEVSILYGGCTLANTVEGRATHDAKADDGRFWPDFYRHVQHVTRLTLWKFRKPVRYPATQVLDFRILPFLGEIEAIIVTSLGYSLNSEQGGYRDRYHMPQAFNLLFETSMIGIPPQMPGIHPSNPLPRKIHNLFKGYRSLLSSNRLRGYDTGPAISERAFQAALLSAAALQTVENTCISLTVGDDCPKEAFTGRIGGVMSEASGRAFDTLRRFLHQMYDIPITGDLSPEYITAYFGPFVDVSGLTLPSRSTWQANVGFLKAYLQHIRPTIIITLSGLTATLFFKSEGLRHFHDRPQAMYTMDRKSYEAVLGTPAIIHIGPGPADTAIGFPLRHPGQIKYRPVISLKLKHVHVLSLMLAHVLRGVVHERLATSHPSQTDGEGRLAWLTLYVNAYKARVGRSGLLARYQQALGELRELERPYMRLQQQGIDEKGGPQASRFMEVQVSSVQDRARQVDDLIENERERARRGLPPDPFNIGIAGLPIDSPEWRAWAMGLTPGVNMAAAANLRGRTAECRDQSHENSARMLARPTTTDPLTHGDIARAAASGWREQERVEAEERLQVNPETMALHLAKASNIRYDILTDAPVTTPCPRCNTTLLMFALRQKTHRCKIGGDLIIRERTFPHVKRLVYPHDLVLEGVLTDFELSKISEISVLNSIQIMIDAGINPPQSIPRNAYPIWVHDHDTTPLHRQVMAADRLSGLLGRNDMEMNQWEEPNLKLALKSLRSSPFPTAQLSIPKCPLECGFVGLLPSGSYLKHQHRQASPDAPRKQGVLKVDIVVKDLWDLPRFMIRRMLVEHLREPFSVAPWNWSFTTPFIGKDR